MKIFKWMAYAFLGAMSGLAYAAVTLEGTWTPPTKNTDGSQFHYSEIAEYKVFYTFDKTLTKAAPFITVPAGKETIRQEIETPPNPATNEVKFAVSVVSIYGEESDLSNVLTEKFTVTAVPKVPQPPTVVKISVSCDKECVIELVE